MLFNIKDKAIDSLNAFNMPRKSFAAYTHLSNDFEHLSKVDMDDEVFILQPSYYWHGKWTRAMSHRAKAKTEATAIVEQLQMYLIVLVEYSFYILHANNPYGGNPKNRFRGDGKRNRDNGGNGDNGGKKPHRLDEQQ
jgi:hypothetical protein